MEDNEIEMPVGCVCEITSWMWFGELKVNEICFYYRRGIRHGTSNCKHCEHDEGCHPRPEILSADFR